MKILVLVGSLRRDSLNKKLAQNLARLADGGADFIFAGINLPLYNQDLEEDDFPASAQKLKDQIEQADGILIATPEYNRSIPGVLKNALDWTSRPAGENSWRNKPVAIVGATPGLIGTAMAQTNLRLVLGFLGARIMSDPELYLPGADKMFKADGQAIEEEIGHLTEYIVAVINFVKANK